MTPRILACLLVALAAATTARADLEAGAATALREWQPLAEMYAKGLGIPRDDIEALHWYRRAAERGHAASQYNVGLFYAVGRGVAPSEVQAAAWITVAEENGAEQTDLLPALSKHMSAEQLKEAARLADIVRRQCRVD